MRLHLGVAVAALPFDHVAGQGEGAAGKADQGHGTVQGAADLGHGIDDIAQMVVGIGGLEIADRPFFPQGPLELGTLALGEIQAQAHGVRHGEDVGEQDGRVQVVARQGLQGDLGGQGRRLAQVQEAARPGTCRAVFREVAAGLAHQPGRRVAGGLPQQRAQEGIVLEGGHGLVHQMLARILRHPAAAS
jgi:hypothetical protein